MSKAKHLGTGIVILIALSFLLTIGNRKSSIEAFMPVQSENTNSTFLNLANSRIGSINNIPQMLSDPKIREEFIFGERNFRLSKRSPLLQSSVAETPQNPQVLRSGGLPDDVINKIVPLQSRRFPANVRQERPFALFEQNPHRVAQYNPTAINDRFQDSSGARNFIDVGPGLYNDRLRRAVSAIKKNYGIQSGEMIGLSFQPVNRLNPIKASEIRQVAQVFIDLLNQHLTKVENKQSRLIYLDKEDAAIEKSFPIKKRQPGRPAISNLEREFTKYTIVFFVFDRDALMNRGFKAVFIRNTTEDTPISSQTVKILRADLIGEKGGRLVPGAPSQPELYNLGRSRDEQRMTESEILKLLKKRTIKTKEAEVFCFGTTLPLDTTDRETCEQAGGIFDTPVKVNEECPFFKANTNYLNSRGGVKGGFCELPLGMNLKGFRNIDKNPSAKPLCYNCIDGFYGFKTLGPCCEDQANDKVAYPTLSSPDFAFPSDTRDRFAARKQLHTRDLSWARRGFNFENIPPGITTDQLQEQELGIPASIFGTKKAKQRAAIEPRDTIVLPSGRLATIGDEQSIGAQTRPIQVNDIGVTSQVI